MPKKNRFVASWDRPVSGITVIVGILTNVTKVIINLGLMHKAKNIGLEVHQHYKSLANSRPAVIALFLNDLVRLE